MSDQQSDLLARAQPGTDNYVQYPPLEKDQANGWRRDTPPEPYGDFEDTTWITDRIEVVTD